VPLPDGGADVGSEEAASEGAAPDAVESTDAPAEASTDDAADSPD
jgi:hypothetical protein